jgi:raffinose/stachyose/melibiose transport system permease protein
VIFLPVTLGVVIQGLVWTLMFNPYDGTYAQILSSIGIHSTYFGDPNLALYMVIMIIIWANVGFAMTIYLAGLQAIPMELYESGRIDGASGWSTFRHITLPLIGASVTVNVLLCLIGSINMLDIIIVTTNGGPGFATYNLPFLVLYNITTSGKTQGFAAAVSVVQFLFTLVVVLIAQRFLRRREVEL